MYHYQKNIGDYRSATMHFTLLEHGIYNQLLDWYYLDESPITSDNRTLFRRLSAHTEDEQKAVLMVLEEMFTPTDSGWVQKRVEREIASYHAKAEQARAAGKLGGRPRKTATVITENRDGSEKKADAKPTVNQEPITNNHKPINNNTDLRAAFETFYEAYPKHVGKPDALKAWMKLKPSPELLNAILIDIRKRIDLGAWCIGPGKAFIPGPAPYLNQQKWTDEIIPRPESQNANTNRPAASQLKTPADRQRAELERIEFEERRIVV
jgi:uncharacterized protein YdaU (DUF1376 family)